MYLSTHGFLGHTGADCHHVYVAVLLKSCLWVLSDTSLDY